MLSWAPMSVRLHVNVDHVATLREARGTRYPDPVAAALCCERAGADGITVHLREDRRHIQDRDVELLRALLQTRMNLEMAATDPMLEIALRTRPDKVTLVPERREERTTERGLDVVGDAGRITPVVRRLQEAGITVSLFIDPEREAVRASAELGVEEIELHTGSYAEAVGEEGRRAQLTRLREASDEAGRVAPRLSVAAGHGLTLRNVPALLEGVPRIEELNIGHALVGDALFLGLEGAVRAYREVIARGRPRSEA